MAWIESHQELARHPKTRKLARLLGVSVPAAIGHLHLLWWWAVDYAEDGCLGRYTAEDVADAVLWEGEPQRLWDALHDARWLDDGARGVEIHDWPEYAGRLLEARRRDAARKRTARRQPEDVRRTSAGQPAEVHSPSGVTVPNRTLPDSTEPDRVIPSLREGATRAPARAPAREDGSPTTGNPRVQATIDALRELHSDVHLTPRDYAALKRSSTPPELIAETYDAVARGTWGDDFMRKRLSVHEAIEWANAYAARRDEGIECSCAERLEFLKINRNSNPYCELHGDVREVEGA